MTYDKLRMVKSLVEAIPDLTTGQLHWLQRVVTVFSTEHHFTLIKTDLLDEATLQNFGDAMRIHHSFSAEPFSKDKFEYVFVKVLQMSGHNAELSPKGNPGHDATVDGVRLSLKTQADKSVKPNVIWISKFMELGKGNWGDEPTDLNGLRDQFLKHMKNYDRILTLRALAKGPRWSYELVEIPKKLLNLARSGAMEMKSESKQFPKPGYCHVRKSNKETIFDLYFDGGSERKLQIKNLSKDLCSVHATWSFSIPQE
jgi:type II restriction enzyme